MRGLHLVEGGVISYSLVGPIIWSISFMRYDLMVFKLLVAEHVT